MPVRRGGQAGPGTATDRRDWVEDAAGNRTEFQYDAASGLRAAVIDPQTNATRYAYNDRGQVTHTWGDTPYQVKYVYDDWARMAEMRW